LRHGVNTSAFLKLVYTVAALLGCCMAGLPPEAYAIWESYPWRFGEPYCLLKTMLTEMTASASILTIVAFTVERYIAICHPLRAHYYSRPSRYIIKSAANC